MNDEYNSFKDFFNSMGVNYEVIPENNVKHYYKNRMNGKKALAVMGAVFIFDKNGNYTGAIEHAVGLKDQPRKL